MSRVDSHRDRPGGPEGGDDHRVLARAAGDEHDQIVRSAATLDLAIERSVEEAIRIDRREADQVLGIEPPDRHASPFPEGALEIPLRPAGIRYRPRMLRPEHDQRLAAAVVDVVAAGRRRGAGERAEEAVRRRRPVIVDVVWTLSRGDGHATLIGLEAPPHVQRLPGRRLLVLRAAVAVLAGVTERGPVHRARPRAADVHQREPDGAADHSVGPAASPERVGAGGHAELLGDRTVYDDERSTWMRG